MTRVILFLAALLALAPPARADVDVADAAVLLPVEIPEPAEEWVHVELPPSVFAHLRYGTYDLRLVDVEGRELPLTILTRDGSTSSARASLEPRLASRKATASGVALLFDLRVRAAPGLVLELDLRGAIREPIRVTDATDPAAGPWEEIPFQPEISEEGRLSGRAVVPAGAGARWVRVVVPSRDAQSVRVARAAATVPRHRAYFKPTNGTPPLTLVVGLGARPGAMPVPFSAPTSWNTGVSARVDTPSWLETPAELRAPDSQAPLEGGRPTPWAELGATAMTLALTIWAVLLRKEG